MKRGITVERKYDHNDIPCIVIKKKRGKLALDEIQDILRFEDYQQWNGQYVPVPQLFGSHAGGQWLLGSVG